MNSTSGDNQDLRSLLLIVKKNFFKGHKPTMIGKFEWLEISEKQVERYLKNPYTINPI